MSSPGREYKQRAAVLSALHAGRKPFEVAKLLKVPKSTVYDIKNRYQPQGQAGVHQGDGDHPSRCPLPTFTSCSAAYYALKTQAWCQHNLCKVHGQRTYGLPTPRTSTRWIITYGAWLSPKSTHILWQIATPSRGRYSK